MKTKLKVKVCGLRDPKNISDIVKLKPDMVGFIFYDKSKRFVNDQDYNAILKASDSAQRIGIFVNAPATYVVEKVKSFALNGVQLHGDEPASLIEELKRAFSDLIIIKAISVADKLEFETLLPYKDLVDYFLFDTASKAHGGSGKHFSWELLDNYNLKVPFFLSGGIKVQDAEVIKLKLANWPMLIGVDLNSQFEIGAGIKDPLKISKFMEDIND